MKSSAGKHFLSHDSWGCDDTESWGNDHTESCANHHHDTETCSHEQHQQHVQHEDDEEDKRRAPPLDIHCPPAQACASSQDAPASAQRSTVKTKHQINNQDKSCRDGNGDVGGRGGAGGRHGAPPSTTTTFTKDAGMSCRSISDSDSEPLPTMPRLLPGCSLSLCVCVCVCLSLSLSCPIPLLAFLSPMPHRRGKNMPCLM